jgi:hypothetical protein
MLHAKYLSSTVGIAVYEKIFLSEFLEVVFTMLSDDYIQTKRNDSVGFKMKNIQRDIFISSFPVFYCNISDECILINR